MCGWGGGFIPTEIPIQMPNTRQQLLDGIEVPPPWLCELYYPLDALLLFNPETGARLLISRREIENSTSVIAVIREAIAKHEKTQDPFKPWDGSRKLDL